MDQSSIPKMSNSRGALLSVATNSAFRWSPVGEVTESLTLNSRSMDEFYPELRVHLERPPEPVDSAARSFDCVVSPQSRSPTGRNAFSANGCSKLDKVKVYVRMRPFSESEKVCPLKQVLCLIGETIVVRELDQKLTGISKEPPHKAEAIEFKVDYLQDDSYLQVHSEIHKEESQKRMYGALGVPCIESALDGYNTTILAYGQTGSGKTYTMMGDNTKAGRGLIPRLASDLMTKINEEGSNGVLYTVQVSYLEIYQEKIRDLLAEDDVEEDPKPPSVPQPSLDSSGTNSHEKVLVAGSNPELKLRVSGHNVEEKVRVYSNNLEEKATFCFHTGSLTENSYTSSFLNKAALQRQLEVAAQKHSKIKSEHEKSPLENPHSNSAHDGGTNRVRSPKTKPAFDTVFNKQKIHKHYRTFPTVMEEAAPLRKQNFLKIREHPITGPFVEGLLWKDVFNWYDMENLMKQGSTSRTTAATDMNEQSSRSHAVFSIRLTKKLGPDLFGVHPSSVNYINLVDLAGSEKLPKLCSGAVTGQRTLEESRCINRSLSQLNEVILSLSTSRFVSYRNSVLTWLLKESLGGNSRTFMVANISPTEKDLRESINTLRYATTASRIPPPVALDQDPRNKLIKKLKEEISTLRTLLSSFTTVKENAPSDQLPSLQGFKVPCLDVGLQVATKPRGLLDKGSQTENHYRDVGQQTIARRESADAGFQIGLKDGGALDMGNPTALLDSGRVDIGHQTLILNVCACDFGHQASANDFGVLDAGLQATTLRELGAVTVSQQGTLSDWVANDVCLHCTPQGCEPIDLVHQTPLRDCGAVDVGNQMGLTDCRDVEAWNQVTVQDLGDVDSRNQTTLPHRGVDARIQITLQDQGDVGAGNEVALSDREAVDSTNHTTFQKCEEVDAENQMTSQNLGVVGRILITPQNWVVVDAGNQITLQNLGDLDAASQIALRDWGFVDVGSQTSSRNLGTIDVGNQITIRDSGVTDAAHHTNPADFGSKDAGHQTILKIFGVNKATECTTVQLDVSHQTDWREFGASEAGIQVIRQKPATIDNGYQVSWMDFGASDNGDQFIWKDFGSSDVGHQITAEEDPKGHRLLYNLKECGIVADDELQVDWSGLRKLFDFGQQVSWRDFCAIEIDHQVDLNDDNEGTFPDHRPHWENYGSICAQHRFLPNVLASTNFTPQMTLGNSDAVDSGHETAPKLLRPVDYSYQVNWKDCDPSACRHRIINRDVDGGLDIEQMDIGLQSSLCYCWAADSGQQTDGTCRLTSDVELQTSQTDFEVSDARNQDTITSDVEQHKVLFADGGRADLGPGTDDCHTTLQDCWGEDVGQQIAGRNLEKVDELISLYESRAHDNEDVGQQAVGRKLEQVDELISLYECSARDNEDVAQRTGGRELEKVDELISVYESRTHDNCSSMIKKKLLASDQVNPLDWRNNGAVEVGYRNSRSNLGAIDSAKVGVVKERKAQFEQKNLRAPGHQTTLLERPGSPVVQQASPRGVKEVTSGHQTGLKVEDGKDKESPVDWKQLAVVCRICGRATDVKLQTNIKTRDGIDAGVQTNWNKNAVKGSQPGRRENFAGAEFGCQAAFEEFRSRTFRHKSTATDLFLGPLEVDGNGLDRYRAVEAWKRFQCGVCGASSGNSMVLVSTLVPIQEVAADIGLQTSWVDFCATAVNLQTPTTGCAESSDVYPIALKVLEAVNEGNQFDREELHPFHEQKHHVCWAPFGASDARRQQTLFKVSRSLDLDERRPLVNNVGEAFHVGPQNHLEECKICNTGCQDCEQDCVVQKWQHQSRQEVGQVIHNWQHHQEIVLSEPSYSLTQSDADTINTDEETSWNASWGSRHHQNPPVHRDDGRSLEFLQDVRLKHVRANNVVGGLPQCTDCRAVDKHDLQASLRDFATVQVQQQQPGGVGALEGTNCSTEGRFDSVSTITQSLKKEDEERFVKSHISKKKGEEEAIGGIPQTQPIQKDTSRACEFSQQTHLQSYRFNNPEENLKTHGDFEEKDQRLNGKLGNDQDSICLSLLREFRGGDKKSGNVPAEEAFHLCSLWTLAKLKSRMEWCTIHSEKDCLKYRISLATTCRGLVSQPPIVSGAEVATQTDSCPEDSTDHKRSLSNTFQNTCLLLVFVVLRIAAPEKGSLVKERQRQAGKRSPFLTAAAPRKVRILSCLSDSTIDERRRLMSRREYRPPKSKHLRYCGVEPLTFRSTTPFFIQTSGGCSLVRTTRVDRGPRSGNTTAADAGGQYYKILCGFPSRRRVVHFLKEGVNRLGSNRGAQIFVEGLSEDHSEFIYMPAHRCVQKKGYVVARLVAPGAMAFLNGLPMLEHKELFTGDVLVLRDLRYRSSVCTLHFFDLVKFP